jgi:hypothetical protein
VSKRLGSTDGANDLRQHPFFEGVDWLMVIQRKQKPPYVPKLRTKTDTSNFDSFFLNQPAIDSFVNSKIFEKEPVLSKPFKDFEFNRASQERGCYQRRKQKAFSERPAVLQSQELINKNILTKIANSAEQQNFKKPLICLRQSVSETASDVYLSLDNSFNTDKLISGAAQANSTPQEHSKS